MFFVLRPTATCQMNWRPGCSTRFSTKICKARISADHFLVAVYQFVDLVYDGDVGCSDHHAMHQPKLIVFLNVRYGTEVILGALLCLVPFRVTLANSVLGRTRRMNNPRIDHGALAQQQTRSPK